MKKLIIIPTLLFTAGIYKAQTSKGNFMLGGNVGYSFNQTMNNDTTPARHHTENAGSNFNGGLSGGYFIKDNIAVGVIVNYSNNSSRSQNLQMGGTQLFINQNDYSNDMVSGGMFLRQYKILGQSRFALFYQVNATYGIGTSLTRQQSSFNGAITESVYRGRSSVLSVNVYPGLTYFVTKRIGIEATLGSVGYSYMKDNNNRSSGLSSERTTQNLNVNFALSSLSLGVRIYLGKKKDL